MSDEESSLRVRTGEMTIELSGKAEALREAYDALAPLLRERVEKEAVRGASRDQESGSAEGRIEASEASSGGSGTKPMYRVADGEDAEESPSAGSVEKAEAGMRGPAERHCRVHMHESGYRQVYMIDGVHLREVGLGVLSPESLGVLHVSEAAADVMTGVLPTGETLWREIDD